MIEKKKLTGPIYCKDTDNYFSVKVPDEGNFVSTIDLCESNLITPNNKSYIKTNNLGCVVNIVEKKVVSSRFCCGLYVFKSSEEYVKYNNSLLSLNDIYLSDIIHKMILDNKVFNEIPAKDYIDWGTSNDWNRFRGEYKVVLLDIDEVLVENSCGYMKPFIRTTTGIK